MKKILKICSFFLLVATIAGATISLKSLDQPGPIGIDNKTIINRI